jgi:hypothetical protein
MIFLVEDFLGDGVASAGSWIRGWSSSSLGGVWTSGFAVSDFGVSPRRLRVKTLAKLPRAPPSLVASRSPPRLVIDAVRVFFFEGAKASRSRFGDGLRFAEVGGAARDDCEGGFDGSEAVGEFEFVCERASAGINGDDKVKNPTCDSCGDKVGRGGDFAELKGELVRSGQ